MNLKKGFTLIELLVVIAIIGVLSSIVISSLNTARAKARDARRSLEIRQLITVLQLYFSDNNSFPPTTGCLGGWCCLGHGDSGTCWVGGFHGSTALDNSLSPKYISKLPDDPLNNTSRPGDAYMYRIDTDANGTYATLHWGIEKTNPASKDCVGGTYGDWGGGNYYCMLQVR